MSRGLNRFLAIPLVDSDYACQVPPTTAAALEGIPDSPYTGSYYSPVLPMQNVTPLEGTCCQTVEISTTPDYPYSFHGPDVDGDGLCEPNHKLWGSATWKNLGFAIDGPHRFVYSFTPSVDETGDDVFTMEAVTHPNCHGTPATVRLQAHLEPQTYPCDVSFEPFMELIGPFGTTLGAMEMGRYYQHAGIDDSSAGIDSPSEPPEGSDAPFEVEYYDSFEVLLYEAIEALEDLRASIDSYYGATCLLPQSTLLIPWEPCCWYDSTLETDGDNLCSPDPSPWLVEPWIDLDFSVDHPTPFQYKIEYGMGYYPYIGVTASRDIDCDGYASELSIFGIADEATCTITWLEGYGVHPMLFD